MKLKLYRDTSDGLRWGFMFVPLRNGYHRNYPLYGVMIFFPFRWVFSAEVDA